MNKNTKARLVSTAKYGGTSGAIGGSLVVILAYLINTFAHVTLPDTVVVAMTVLVTFTTNIVLSRTGIISSEE